MIPLNDLSRGETILNGCYLNGPYTERFERDFGEYLGTDFVAVGNGSDALEIALRCLDIGIGHKVAIAPNAGMYGTLAILNVGATPVFVDVDPETLCISGHEDCDAAIVTHLYGQPIDYKADCKIIEDCSHAHGASINGRKVGTLGDIGIFSFYPTKNLGAYGNGGGISGKYARKAKALSQYGWGEKYHVEYEHGRHSQIDEFQAKVLCDKLSSLDERNKKRQSIRAYYESSFGHKIEFVGYEDSVVHLCVIQVDYREELRIKLHAKGIMTDIHYPVLDYHQKPVSNAYCPIAEMAVKRILSIPCFPDMTDNEIEYVATTFSAIC